MLLMNISYININMVCYINVICACVCMCVCLHLVSLESDSCHDVNTIVAGSCHNDGIWKLPISKFTYILHGMVEMVSRTSTKRIVNMRVTVNCINLEYLIACRGPKIEWESNVLTRSGLDKLKMANIFVDYIFNRVFSMKDNFSNLIQMPTNVVPIFK